MGGLSESHSCHSNPGSFPCLCRHRRSQGGENQCLYREACSLGHIWAPDGCSRGPTARFWIDQELSCWCKWACSLGCGLCAFGCPQDFLRTLPLCQKAGEREVPQLLQLISPHKLQNGSCFSGSPLSCRRLSCSSA